MGKSHNHRNTAKQQTAEQRESALADETNIANIRNELVTPICAMLRELGMFDEGDEEVLTDSLYALLQSVTEVEYVGIEPSLEERKLACILNLPDRKFNRAFQMLTQQHLKGFYWSKGEQSTDVEGNHYTQLIITKTTQPDTDLSHALRKAVGANESQRVRELEESLSSVKAELFATQTLHSAAKEQLVHLTAESEQQKEISNDFQKQLETCMTDFKSVSETQRASLERALKAGKTQYLKLGAAVVAGAAIGYVGMSLYQNKKGS